MNNTRDEIKPVGS